MTRPSSPRRIQKQLAEYLKSGLSPEVIKKISRLPDEMEVGRFLYNAGYYRALLEFSVNNLQKKKPVPWPFVMKALTDHNITSPKEAVKPLLKILLYQFDLKTPGSDRRDRRAQRSFGLPGANQNRAGILSRYKPKNSSKISVTGFEKDRLWFFACGEWAKISPEFQALTQFDSEEKSSYTSTAGLKQSPEDMKSALKDLEEYTEEQSPADKDKPLQEELPSLNMSVSQTSLDQNNKQLNFKTDEPENQQTAHSKKTDEPALSSSAEALDSLSFSKDRTGGEGNWDLSKHPEQSKSGFFSSGFKQINKEDSVDLEEQQLFRQLEFVQAKGLVEEEEKIIRALMRKKPKKYKDLDKELKMKKALDFLQSQKLSGGEGKATHRFLSQVVSKEESSCKVRICEEAALLAEKHPEKTKDLAVFLYMLGRPDWSLKVLERNLKNISEYWFYLNWLLEVRKYAVALDITNRLLVKLKFDSESLFPITYIKAQALYALGEKDKAVSYMSDIVKVRPAYKSAWHFLEEWTKT